MKEEVMYGLIEKLVEEEIKWQTSFLSVKATVEALLVDASQEEKDKEAEELQDLGEKIQDPSSPWNRLTDVFRREYLYQFGTEDQIRKTAGENFDWKLQWGFYSSAFRDAFIEKEVVYSKAYQGNEIFLEHLTDIAFEIGIDKAMEKLARNEAYRRTFPKPEDYIAFRLKNQEGRYVRAKTDEMMVGSEAPFDTQALKSLVERLKPRMSEWIDISFASVLRKELKEIYGLDLPDNWKPTSLD